MAVILADHKDCQRGRHLGTPWGEPFERDRVEMFAGAFHNTRYELRVAVQQRTCLRCGYVEEREVGRGTRVAKADGC